jgi:hypothetical protein
MGHRASVLYVIEDQYNQIRYFDVYSHWGASELRLKFGCASEHNGITDDDPTASGEVKTEDVEVSELVNGDVVTDERWRVAQDDCIKERGSIEEWKEMVKDNWNYEAGYVVDTRGDEWDVTAYDCIGRHNTNPSLREVEEEPLNV